MSDGHVGFGLSALAAALPIIIYLIVIWWLDRYEREPFWLVGLTFLYGALGAIFLGALLSISVMVAAGIHDMSTSAVVVAPICEEIAKGLLIYIFLATRHFDNTTDGLIYGAASGLGFAMTENFLYFVDADQRGGIDVWTTTVLLRSLFTALMHCAATASFGAILGRFRYRGGVLQWLLAPLLGLMVAMSLHATFNGLLVAGDQSDYPVGILAFVLIPLVAITLFTITMVSLGREHRMLAVELREEAATGLIPAAHADILPFHRRRWRNGWLDPRIDKKRYVRCATMLAFRKWQLKLPSGRRQQHLAVDLQQMRREIHWHLNRFAQPGMPPAPGMMPPPGAPPLAA
jgi:RsiW-degrading membrane proteinase PrsW (M82 family)